MSIERDGSVNKLLDRLPSGLSKTDVERLTGILSETIHLWEKKGLVTPKVLFSSGDSRGTKLYDSVQLARVMLIRSLREEGWQFPEIRNEICKPCWLERNKDIIERFLDGLSKD